MADTLSTQQLIALAKQNGQQSAALVAANPQVPTGGVVGVVPAPSQTPAPPAPAPTGS